MADLNRIEIIGNVGKEPELHITPEGKSVANFSVAVNFKYNDTESVEWFDIVVWNKLAESCNSYLAKGQQVFVEGRLQTSLWTDRENIKRSKIKIVAYKVIFLGQRHEKNVEQENE